MKEFAWHFEPWLVIEALERLLPPAPDDSAPELARLRDAMRDAVLEGGKRLRSLLALESYGVVSRAQGKRGSEEEIVPAACALELIHAYSLVHDDLPAMDNADTRRGRPSNHVRWGHATAILVGDGLQSLAFESLCGLTCVPAERVVQAVSLLAQASGEAGMVGGQAIDIAWSQENVAEAEGDSLLEMHALKTGALIRASGEIGAVLAGGNESQVSALREYGKYLGRAFQIQDDVLDVEGDPEVTGKKATDEANFKITAPGAFGLERAKAMAVESSRAAVESLSQFGPEADTLRALAAFVTSRKQ
jgi:geranylgeranyl pyrophosphate synthase